MSKGVTDLVPCCCVEPWASARVSESKRMSKKSDECEIDWQHSLLYLPSGLVQGLWAWVYEWQHSLLYLLSDLVQGHWAWVATLLALLTFRFGAGTLSMNGNTPCFTYLQLWWLLALLTFRFGAGTLSSQYTTPGGTTALRRDSSPSLQFDLHYRYTHTCTNTVSSVFIDLRCTHVDVQVQMSI